MAGLYLLMTAAMGCIFFGKRNYGMGLALAAIVLCWMMLWHHATDTLKINW